MYKKKKEKRKKKKEKRKKKKKRRLLCQQIFTLSVSCTKNALPPPEMALDSRHEVEQTPIHTSIRTYIQSDILMEVGLSNSRLQSIPLSSFGIHCPGRLNDRCRGQEREVGIQ